MNSVNGKRLKIATIFVVIVFGVVVVLLLPRIPQDPTYHDFADQRLVFGIPNFWNVVSNLPFIAVGLAGLGLCFSEVPRGGLRALAPVYRLFFLGIFLVGLGSAFYHLNPSTGTLIWDRLPMSVTFMTFFSLVWGEHVSEHGVKRVLAVVLILGLGAVTYWHFTEARGVGDLRPYVLVQFLPMLLIPLILIFFPSKLSTTVPIWSALAVYVVAKFAEHWDAAIFEVSGITGGHALKHVLAAMSALFVFIALIKRRSASTPPFRQSKNKWPHSPLRASR